MALYNNLGPNNPLPLDTQGKPKFQEGSGNKPPRAKKQKGGYTVQGGDNYFTLAEQIYGSQRFAGLLIEANGGRPLRPGDIINVPQTDQTAAEVNFSPWAMEQARNLTANTAYGQRQQQAAQTQAQVSLTNPGAGTVSSVGANNYAGLAAQTPPTPYTPPTTGVAMPPGYVNYSALAARGTPRLQNSPSYPIAGQVVPPHAGWYGATQQEKKMTKTGGKTTGKPGDVPVFQGQGTGQAPLSQGQQNIYGNYATAPNYYTGVGMPSYSLPGPYDPYNPAYIQRPPNPNAAGNTFSNPTGNQQILPTQGMTGAQTALALESGIANKPAGTYQVQGTVQRPIYSATEVDVYGRPKIVGWETVPTGTVNVGVMGTKPAAYVGFTGDVLNGGKPGQGRIIGGGEGYADYTPAGIPRPPGTPAYGRGQMGGAGSWGGSGGRRGGGGGGGGPTGGGGRGAPNRYTPPAVFAQANSLPGGYRNPARDLAGLSRTGLVTWRLP